VHIGVDVGSISLKFALVALPSESPLPEEIRNAFLTPDPEMLPGGAHAYLLSYDRLLGDPNRKVPERLGEWVGRIGAGRIRGVAFTGKSGTRMAQELEARYENDFRCLVRGVTAIHHDVRTIFEMGGENAKVIRLEAATEGGFGASSACSSRSTCRCAEPSDRSTPGARASGGFAISPEDADASPDRPPAFRDR